MKFRATIELSKRTATGISVPDEVMTSLGSSKRPAVRVTIGGHSYRTTVGSMGGKYLIPVSAEVRTGAGVAAGDEVDVNIELDTEPRELAVPEDFSKALDSKAEAKRFFEGLSYSNKRRFVLNIEEAKTAETRQRRIDKVICLLNEGRIQ
ncbi:Bacteriocin-protection, YdeI or OmpD-Associated [Paenibacillus sp. UNC496MF]|uniref:YdeI/OmpD-associated family protein n=1 Tax=Paenibacillus sp. UNC496MF TaxID=1502753 RepID=UPI0008E40DC5|nr:YdeI/OmpD-associated family protein [Paenibacillus sp. UNC496MF]SFJ55995.1 Bacteriocin-protection, YdeI or OmpD-Associated [Paenibacillus sp. UNC496MF]